MNETLFSQIQRLLERTYTQVGINLEDCIIDRARSVHLSKLAGASARELNEIARTFLRHAGDQLYVGIYYSRWLIDQLERHDPRSGLSDFNIRSLIVFVEELNHALHAALQFNYGQRRIASEEFARDLELQAQIDTYLVLLFLAGNVPLHSAMKICAVAISKLASLPPATPSISIPSTVSGVLMRSANFVRLIIPPKKRTSSR